MSKAEALLCDLGVDVTPSNVEKVEKHIKEKKVREIFKNLINEFGSKKGYTLSTEQAMSAIGIHNRDVFKRLIENGTIPIGFVTGDKQSSHKRYFMMDIATFLAGRVD